MGILYVNTGIKYDSNICESYLFAILSILWYDCGVKIKTLRQQYSTGTPHYDLKEMDEKIWKNTF